MLNVHKSNKMPLLVDALAKLLIDSPGDSPFVAEKIVVQSRGMKAWLLMELSKRMGILANTNFMFPRPFVIEAFKIVLGDKLQAKDDFNKTHLAWSTMAILPEQLNDPAFLQLKRYLQDDFSFIKLYQLSNRIAKTFDEYVVYRPELILKWEQGQDSHWQAKLWRGLTNRLGQIHQAANWQLFDELVSSSKEINWPFKRINLFGITSLPPLYMEILGKISEAIDVNIYLFCPSNQYWADIHSKRELLGRLRSKANSVEALEDLHIEQGNELLLSMGSQMRDFQVLLEGFSYNDLSDHRMFVDPAMSSNPPTLLKQIQSDIYNLNQPNIKNSETLQENNLLSSDNSIAIHSCHSPTREVQVLHDQLLHMFEQDDFCGKGKLYPHEVVVMIPEVETYAPFIEAVFEPKGNDEIFIPYNISDRNFRINSALVDAFLHLLLMGKGRVTFREVFDLLSLKDVYQNFQLSPSDIELLQNWCFESGVRWGIDKKHRGRFNQPEYQENTWQFGLNRLLLGMTMPEDEMVLFNGCLAHDAIEGSNSIILGRFLDYTKLLFEILLDFEKALNMQDWSNLLANSLGKLFVNNENNQEQHQAILFLLTELQEISQSSGFEKKLNIELIRKIITDNFAGEYPSKGILTGSVTFCNIQPMRTIPFKVVCLMGMNYNTFPRSANNVAFDLISNNPQIGDHSSKLDDYSLFLEAILSAEESLVITYIGQSIKDNSTLPASGAVNKLVDQICNTVTVSGVAGVSENESAIIERLLVKHPLQSFSPEYFYQTKKGSKHSLLISYSKEALAGACAITGSKATKPEFFSSSFVFEQNEINSISLGDLVRFFKLPAEYFLAHRLGIVFPSVPEEANNREPFELDGLENYMLGNTMLNTALKGQSLKDSKRQIIAKGILPLGTPGDTMYDSMISTITPFANIIKSITKDSLLDPVDIELMICNKKIHGILSNIFKSNRLSYSLSKFSESRLLELWIYHLALNVISLPAYPKTSTILFGNEIESSCYTLQAVQNPLEVLKTLVQLFLDGQLSPQPLLLKPSFAFAKTYGKNIHKGGETADITALAKCNTVMKKDFQAHLPAVTKLFNNKFESIKLNSDFFEDFKQTSLLVFSPLIEHLKQEKEGF